MSLTPITVVIPTRQRAVLLRECLESVLAQSFGDFEVIIFDNASTDETEVVCRSFSDSRIKYVKRAAVIDVRTSWRSALESATSPWVAFMHDDDLWEQDHLARAWACIQSYPDARMVTASSRYFGADSQIQRLTDYESLEQPRAFTPMEALPLWLYRDQTQCSAVVIHRQAIGQLDWGPEGLDYGIDYLLFAQTALRNPWVYQPVPTCLYRIHAASDTATWRGRKRYRANVTMAYIFRYLVTMALESGCLSEADLLEKSKAWPVARLSPLILALVSRATPLKVRALGWRLLAANRRVLNAPDAFKVFRVTSITGGGGLGLIEYVYRFLGGWSPSR